MCDSSHHYCSYSTFPLPHHKPKQDRMARHPQAEASLRGGVASQLVCGLFLLGCLCQLHLSRPVERWELLGTFSGKCCTGMEVPCPPERSLTLLQRSPLGSTSWRDQVGAALRDLRSVLRQPSETSTVAVLDQDRGIRRAERVCTFLVTTQPGKRGARIRDDVTNRAKKANRSLQKY